MARQKWVDILGYVIILMIIVVGLFPKFFAIEGYIFLLAAISGLRIYLFYKIPKSERRVYRWAGLAWRTSLLLHPVSQMAIIMIYVFAIIRMIIL